MAARQGCIYRLTAPEGKCYIGQTIQDPRKRWSKHKTLAEKNATEGCCPALSNAIRKYGWDNFTKEILLTCDVKELDMHEIRLIREYKAESPHGYNLSSGGGREGHIMPGSTKRRMRRSALTSKRNYKKSDPRLPRKLQDRGTYYRVESITYPDGKRVKESYNFSFIKYGGKDKAFEIAYRCWQQVMADEAITTKELGEEDDDQDDEEGDVYEEDEEYEDDEVVYDDNEYEDVKHDEYEEEYYEEDYEDDDEIVLE